MVINMTYDCFSIDALSYKDCAMFLGGRLDKMPEEIIEYMKKAEKEILSVASPKAVIEIFDIEAIISDEEVPYVKLVGTDFTPKGQSICKHLKDRQKAVFLCATAGPAVDRAIKKGQITDMAYAMVLDAMGGVYVETVCDQVEEIIKKELNTDKLNFRFGLGYGDLPISQEPEFIHVLDATREIGVCSTGNYLLVPCKSVAAIIGIAN